MTPGEAGAGADAPTRRAWARHLGLADPTTPNVSWLTGGTIARQFSETATAFPDRVAVAFPDDRVSLTHGQLDLCAGHWAGLLTAHGLSAGDRVILCGSNSAAFVSAYLAVLRIGAVVVLASPALSAPELAHLVHDSGARVALVEGASTAALCDMVATVVRLDVEVASYAPVAPVELDLHATAILAYTSGTTGTPKGVRLTHTNVLSSIRAVARAWRWTSEDVVIHALPLTHQHGLGGLQLALLSGSQATILRSFDPETFAATARECGATILLAVPAMYERLLAHGPGLASLPASRGGSLRLAVSGSAPLSEELFARLAEHLGEPVLERYGTTESGLDVSNPYDGPRVSGSIGLPLPGVEVRVVGPTGEAVDPGEDGELLVRGPQVCAEYWRNPQATADAIDADGWFRTGDMARCDPLTGYWRITGRLKELIISGGYNIYPREVELALESHPAVVEAAVAGVASVQWGEEVVAWVVAAERAELDTAELLAFAKTRLASYKCPKRIVIVESLPRNQMGKLQRGALPDPDASHQRRAPSPTHE